ncbi:MAG TPA: hypothetical protein VIL72_12885 [Beijerinckiaceae bacterium]
MTDKANEELKANARKALEMKEQAAAQPGAPPHRTEHVGGVPGPQKGMTDTSLGREGTYEANLKRSHNARVGDTGKTTGPGSS